MCIVYQGIGAALTLLSIDGPSGMVASVEAVEVHERKAETFEEKRNGHGGGDCR
jgi:hypothetical protein